MKILVLDDDPMARKLIAAKVTKIAEKGPLPCVVIVSESGSLGHGLRLVEETNPDVVLLDLNLEDSLPSQTIACIQRLSTRAAVVVISGSEDQSVILSAINAGAQDYLLKDQCWNNPPLMVQTIERAYQRFTAARLSACNQIQDDISAIKKTLGL